MQAPPQILKTEQNTSPSLCLFEPQGPMLHEGGGRFALKEESSTIKTLPMWNMGAAACAFLYRDITCNFIPFANAVKCARLRW